MRGHILEETNMTRNGSAETTGRKERPEDDDVLSLGCRDGVILDMSVHALRQRQRREAFMIMRLGPYRATGKVRIKSRGNICWRSEPSGRARVHVGTADDLSTAVPDDTLADHLVKATDVTLYDLGYGSWVDLVGDTPDEDDETADEEKAAEGNGSLPHGIYYSTASEEHQARVERRKE